MPKQASAPSSKTLILSTLLILILALSFLNLSIYLNSNERSKVLASQTDLYQEIEFWNKLLQESPTYLTGWVELAKINISLGDIDEAKYDISVAEKIDPNSKVVNEVKKLLE